MEGVRTRKPALQDRLVAGFETLPCCWGALGERCRSRFRRYEYAKSAYAQAALAKRHPVIRHETDERSGGNNQLCLEVPARPHCSFNG